METKGLKTSLRLNYRDAIGTYHLQTLFTIEMFSHDNKAYFSVARFNLWISKTAKWPDITLDINIYCAFYGVKNNKTNDVIKSSENFKYSHFLNYVGFAKTEK